MEIVKKQIPCPYCAAQNLRTVATQQREPARLPGFIRYGCPHEHYFARKAAEVLERGS